MRIVRSPCATPCLFAIALSISGCAGDRFAFVPADAASTASPDATSSAADGGDASADDTSSPPDATQDARILDEGSPSESEAGVDEGGGRSEGGSPDAGRSEGGSDEAGRADARAPDAGTSEGGSGEAGAPEGGEGDAGGDAEGGSPADPCASGAIHALCDDFDEAALHMFWALDPTCAWPVLDSTASVSPPNSLLSQVTTTGGCASISDALPRAPFVHCEADVRFDATPKKMATTLLSLSFGSSALASYQVALAYDPTQVGMAGQVIETAVELDGGSPTSDGGAPWPRATATETWSHVVLQVDLTTQTASGTFDTNVASTSLVNAPATFSTVTFHVGASGGVSTVRFDNVFCNLL
jgi:hypothetical protein